MEPFRQATKGFHYIEENATVYNLSFYRMFMSPSDFDVKKKLQSTKNWKMAMIFCLIWQFDACLFSAEKCIKWLKLFLSCED